MKAKIYLLLLLASVKFATAQTSQAESKPAAIRFDGVYECKEWKFIDGKVDNPEPAYYRFFPDGTLLFCHYQYSKDKDSTITPKEIFNSILTQEVLDKIKDNMTDDPANVYRIYKKFSITAYKYQKLPNGLCFDILSERPNCLGKPNMKIPSAVIIKTDNGNPADDRYYKFIPVN